jgi:exonuclease SbcD
MRILHTSDWHLGRSFGPLSLHDDQQAFIDWLVQLCAEERIELVVVAGDIYDRSIPPTEAVVMFRDALVRLQAAGHTLAIITGNHDGADRVAAYDELMDASNVYVRGGYSKIGEVIHLSFNDGPLDLVMLPFLDPQAAPDSMAAPSGDPADDESVDDDAFARRVRRTHHSVLEAAIAAARPNVQAPRTLAVSHAFVAGGEASDSERQLTVGGTSTVDVALFDGFSYTALGHLHRPQHVRPTVRYSGTPLAYSFSEEHGKSVTIVDMDGQGAATITEVPVPVGRPVRTMRGTLDELLAARPTATAAHSITRAILTDAGVVHDAKQRLSAVYPYVVEIVLDSPITEGEGLTGALANQRTMSPVEVADAFWNESVGEPPTESQAALLHTALVDAEGKVA